MKIFVTGTRGIPNIPGGVESHCQELYPRIAAKGHEVLLSTRSPYVTNNIGEWQGVKLIGCYAPQKKSLEAIVHTFISLIKARMYNVDIVHIHAIGPSLLTPVARLMGLKVIFTNHGPDYNRHKWGKFAKFVLKLGEKMGGLFANEVISISSVISAIMKERCHRDCNLIYNGVTFPQRCTESDFLDQIGAKPGEYILSVARFVPEKGLHDLIDCFKMLDCNYKLVIAGAADHDTDYSKKLYKTAALDNRIILTGYITGKPLNQVYTHARLFVLPSYHEGLPIALLEAMSYGLSVLVSDIPANKEVGLPAERYFKTGNVEDLREKLEIVLRKQISSKEQNDWYKLLNEKYNWDKIAEKTIKVYAHCFVCADKKLN